MRSPPSERASGPRVSVLPKTRNHRQQRGPKAFTARISIWGTPPIQQTTDRSQDEFGAVGGMQVGADGHLVPLQALVWRVGGWLGGTRDRTGCIGLSLRECTRRTQTHNRRRKAK